MKIKLVFSRKEIDLLYSVIGQAEAVASVMRADSKEGGQLKDAKQLEDGCDLIRKLITGEI